MMMTSVCELTEKSRYRDHEMPDGEAKLHSQATQMGADVAGR